MRRAWIIVVVAACYRGSSSQAPGTGDTEGSARMPDLGKVTADTSVTARAPLDGLLQIQPEGMCGGAMPAPNYVVPPLAPAPHIKLRVLKGSIYSEAAPVAELTTAADGTFTADLPPGTYCIARDGRGPKPTPMGKHYDLKCLFGRWEACDATVEVPMKARLGIDIHEPCQWSICYSGPPPP